MIYYEVFDSLDMVILSHCCASGSRTERSSPMSNRFFPASKYVRYDKKTGLWISQRKRIFLLWFLYLRQAVKEERLIDWHSYDGWGGREVVLEARFDDWWKENWCDLFGHKKNCKPRFSISSTQPKFSAMYLALKIYQSRNNGSYKQLAKIFMPERSWANIHSEQTIVGRYINQADNILGNVCEGNFP